MACWKRLISRGRSTISDFFNGSVSLIYVTWLTKGVCVFFGMLLMGGIGSFTLHQMISPEIANVFHERNQLRFELSVLHTHFENISQVAQSRLEMIHLLEKQLEKEILHAAEVTAAARIADAATAAMIGTYGNASFNDLDAKWTLSFVQNETNPSDQSYLRDTMRRYQVKYWLPTLLYTLMLSGVLLFCAFVRIKRLASAEMMPNRFHSVQELEQRRLRQTESSNSFMERDEESLIFEHQHGDSMV